jgi:hypothetical protein|tara:strand:- start:811 stop:3558 length:2748 start_codon:yes stop_codon:yes gene_type:complete
MAVNFNLPTVATTYTDFPAQVIENIDAALQQLSVGLPTTNPSAANVPTGAIRWDSGLNRWRKWNGSAYEDLTDTYNLEANLDVNRLTLSDNDQIRLGNSQDLLIFHSGSNSHIRDNGTGNLLLQGSQVNIQSANGGENMASFTVNNAATLFHNNIARIATTSSGADITGSLTATNNMFVEGGTLSLKKQGDSNSIEVGAGQTGNHFAFIDFIGDTNYTDYGLRLIRGVAGSQGQNTDSTLFHRGTGTLGLVCQDGGKIAFKTNGSARQFINESGQISFGSTNPQQKFDFADGGTPQMIIRSSAASSQDAILTLRGSRTNASTIDKILFQTNDIGGGNYAAGSLLASIQSGKLSNLTTLGFIDLKTCQSSPTGGALGSTDTTVMRLTNTGSVGIGTTTATALLTLASTSPRVVMTDTNTGADHRLNADSGVGNFAIDVDLNAEISDPSFIVNLKGTEKLRLKSNGRLGIGTTSPDCNLHVFKNSAGSVSADNNAVLAIENNNHCVFNMISPNNRSCYIMMGDPQDISAGQIRYDNNSNQLLIDVNGSEAARFGSNRFFGIHTGTVDLPLHVKQTSQTSGAIRIEDADAGARHTDFNISGATTTILSRSNNSHGRVLFQSTNGSNTVENLRLHDNGLGVAIGTTAATASVKLNVFGGRIDCDSQIRAGVGGGGVALTTNDGGGNSNLCFNHANNTPEQNGTSGRISVNADSTGGTATMSFGLVHNASNGTSVGVSEVMQLRRGTQANLGGSGNTLRGQIILNTANTSFPTVTFSGDTDTGISRSSGNQISVITGGTERFRINNNGVDVRSGSATAVNTAKAWIHLDGSGAINRRRHFNVDSVSDLGTGNYRINWDNDFPNQYYVVCFGQSLQPNNGSTHGGLKVTAQTTSRIDVLNCRDENSSDRVDKDMVSVAAFS